MKVPTYDSFQVGANTLPQQKFSAPVSASPQVQRGSLVEPVQFSDESAKQLQRTGAAVTAAGRAADSIMLQMQEQDNQLRVDDALNKAKEESLRLTFDEKEGYSNLRGDSALVRPDKKALPDEYGERLQTTIDSLAETLGNDRQRAAFAQRAGELSTSFKTGAMRHMVSENQSYQLSVSQGIQSTEAQNIAMKWDQPEEVAYSVKRIGAEVYRQGKLTGKSAEWIEAASRDATSKAHRLALESALGANKSEIAMGYLEANSKGMNADDIMVVRKQIDSDTDMKVGVSAAQKTFGKFQSAIEPSDMDRAFNVQGVDTGRAFKILTGTESNGQQFGKDGKPLTSSAGAIGIAQVMPDTAPEAAKLAGLKWDENLYKTDASYNAALGMAYFQKQLQENSGDLSKAYAAYNAGPDRLRQGVKKAHAEGGNWLDHMPEETRNYVAKNMREYGAGGGAPKKPTLEEMDAELRADPSIANNPDRLKVARVELGKYYKMQNDAIKQREDETVMSAKQGVIDNGGNYASLPAAIRSAIPADQVGSVMDLADKIGKGETVKTDPNVYYALTMQSSADPQKFAVTDLRGFVDKLSASDHKHFMDMQAKAVEPGKADDIASSTQQKSAMVAALGLNGEKKGVFMQEADKALYAEQMRKGKELDQSERQRVLDRLVLEGSMSGGFFGNKSGYSFEASAQGRDFTPKFNDDQRRQAIQAFKRNGLNNPTDEQITTLLNARFGTNKPAQRGGASGSF
jgi:soluble lytic murein transglycosylase